MLLQKSKKSRFFRIFKNVKRIFSNYDGDDITAVNPHCLSRDLVTSQRDLLPVIIDVTRRQILVVVVAERFLAPRRDLARLRLTVV